MEVGEHVGGPVAHVLEGLAGALAPAPRGLRGRLAQHAVVHKLTEESAARHFPLEGVHHSLHLPQIAETHWDPVRALPTQAFHGLFCCALPGFGQRKVGLVWRRPVRIQSLLHHVPS
eukprot:1577168-Rhodomonas_salina.1